MPLEWHQVYQPWKTDFYYKKYIEVFRDGKQSYWHFFLNWGKVLSADWWSWGKVPDFSRSDLGFDKFGLCCFKSSTSEPRIGPLSSSFGCQLDHLLVRGEISVLSLQLSDGFLGCALDFIRDLAYLIFGIVALVGFGVRDSGLHARFLVIETEVVCTKLLRFSDHLRIFSCLGHRKSLDSSFHIYYLFFDLPAIRRVTGNYWLKVDIIDSLLATSILLLLLNFTSILVILTFTLIGIRVAISVILLNWPGIMLTSSNKMLRSWVVTDSFPNALSNWIDVRDFHDTIRCLCFYLFKAKKHLLSMRQTSTVFLHLLQVTLNNSLNRSMHTSISLNPANTTILMTIHANLYLKLRSNHVVCVDKVMRGCWGAVAGRKLLCLCMIVSWGVEDVIWIDHVN